MANKKVIGYQITNAKQEIPNGLFSFQIFKTIAQAYEYARAIGIYAGAIAINDLCNEGWFIQQVREGDIETPTYIGNEKKKYSVTFYYHTNVTVSVEAESEAEALALAESEVTKDCYTSQILEGLQEDSSPDIELDEE